jgi:hypothetical protein
VDQMGQESGLANTSRDNACVNGHPGLCYIERCCGVVPRVLDPDYKQDGALVTVYLEAHHTWHTLTCLVGKRFGGGGQQSSLDDTEMSAPPLFFIYCSLSGCVCTKLAYIKQG